MVAGPKDLQAAAQAVRQLGLGEVGIGTQTRRSLYLPLPPETLCGTKQSVSDSFPGAPAKDTLAPGERTVGLGAVRALRPQVSRPAAALFALREDET